MKNDLSKSSIIDQVKNFFALNADWITRRRYCRAEARRNGKTDEEQDVIMEAFDGENPQPIAPDFMRMDLRDVRFTLDAYLSDLAETKIVIFREKHGNREYLVRPWDPCAFGRIASAVIKERGEAGYWLWSVASYDKELANNKKPEPPFSKEYIDNLPTERLKDLAKQEWSSYVASLKNYLEHKNQYPFIQKAESGDLVSASFFVRSRSRGQYETFEVITPEAV